MLTNELSDLLPVEENSAHNTCQCIIPFIQTLPTTDKEVLMETIYGETSQKQYATGNNLSYSTVKSRV